MALSREEIQLLNNINMIAQQEQLGEQINRAILAGENGEIHNDIKAGDEKVKAELTEAITSGNAKTLTQAKSEDQKLKQEITALIEQKHKGILTLVKMKKHNSLDSSAELQAVITELNSLISDLIKCGIMSNT